MRTPVAALEFAAHLVETPVDALEFAAHLVKTPVDALEKATGALNVPYPVNDPLEVFNPPNGAFSRSLACSVVGGVTASASVA